MCFAFANQEQAPSKQARARTRPHTHVPSPSLSNTLKAFMTAAEAADSCKSISDTRRVCCQDCTCSCSCSCSCYGCVKRRRHTHTHTHTPRNTNCVHRGLQRTPERACFAIRGCMSLLNRSRLISVTLCVSTISFSIAYCAKDRVACWVCRPPTTENPPFTRQDYGNKISTSRCMCKHRCIRSSSRGNGAQPPPLQQPLLPPHASVHIVCAQG